MKKIMKHYKSTIKAIDTVIKAIEEDFDPTCTEYVRGCADCDAKMLIAELEWYKDLLVSNIYFQDSIKKKH